MKRVLVVLVLGTVTLGAIGAAYLAGYWPPHQEAVACEAALQSMRANLERAEARNRLYGLQSRLIDLLATVEARNFGDAQGKATAFFDSVQAEGGRPDQDDARPTLEEIAAGRDSLTIALTQNDPTALEMLHGAMTRLREVLGEAPAGVETETSPSPTP